ncbi:vWA domain-containing protein [Streptomyces bambusae]|uniref:Solute-binding protein n=1 Tax=Streptomyces bambusae TaxID=1550616 RepID=A0ABS6Z344_9ACTN|nr:vWA domain-containing protein [Streptomyces bambusae]MBW5482171.1 solute-binding protein [Streptomyces bambusae]
MARFDPRGKANRALLVGVPEYDFKQPDHPDGVSGDLEAVEHNLTGLARSLREGGVFARDEVVVVRPRTVDEFDRQLDTAVKAADGLLLFYFSGHGAVPSTGDELWLQMRGATIVRGGESVFRGSASWKGVLTVLARATAEQVVVILDCCYAGNASTAWDALGAAQRQRTSLLMSVQANNRIDAGGGDSATPFTAQLIRLLRDGRSGHDGSGGGHGGDGGDGDDARDGEGGHGGGIGFADLADRLRAHMSTHHTTLREPPEPWEPQSRPATSGADVLLAAPAVHSPPAPPPAPPPVIPGPPGPPGGKRWGRLGRLGRPVAGRRLVTAVGVPAAVVGLATTAWFTVLGDDTAASCKPPVELRLLTDPDLEPTVRKAAKAYLTSGANRADDGCRRSGITVYSAASAAAVAAFNRQSDPWQRPAGNEENPQRDIGPQPDIWIPASRASVDRARPAASERTYVELEADASPFAYSPVVLAVPQLVAAEAPADRVGSLATLTAALKKREPRAEVRRTDPEYTDAGLLATVGLYGTAPQDPAAAERGVAQSGPPSRTGGELLCTLPDDDAADERTAALVPEFLLRTGVDCDSATRTRRTAAYPDDVPGLSPTFVRVRWRDAGLDAGVRDDAVRRFREWLTGKGAAEQGAAAGGGLAAFAQDGFRGPSGERLPLDPAAAQGTGAGTSFSDFGALSRPERLPEPAGQAAMTAALKGYREANGPGRVLFLLDSSGSMGGFWEGPGGAPAIIVQSLAGLGGTDEYGVWAVGTEPGGGRAHSELLPFGQHGREQAQRTIEASAKVRDVEADPYLALVAALEEMARRGTDDHRPQLIVYVTDDEDNNRLTEGSRLNDLLQSMRGSREPIPVVMASLDSGGCDKGKPDAAVSEASGGRCLDTKGDLVSRLRDEVARTGTGGQG